MAAKAAQAVQSSEKIVLVEDGAAAERFQPLCERVLAMLSEVGTALEDVLDAHDAIAAAQALPRPVLVKMAQLMGRLHRGSTEMSTPICELVRLAMTYATPWHHKSAMLADLHAELGQQQRQVGVALRQAERTSSELARSQVDRRLGHWARLYSHLCRQNRHGRRWLYLLDAFCAKTRGTSPLVLLDGEEEDEDDSEEEDDIAMFPVKTAQSIRRHQTYLTSNAESENSASHAAKMQLAEMCMRVEQLSKEKARLAEKLDEYLVRKPMPDKQAQTDRSFLAGIPAPSLVQEAINTAQLSKEPLSLVISHVSGFCGAVPADLLVVAEAFDADGDAPKERLMTRIPPAVYNRRDAALFEHKFSFVDVCDTDRVQLTLFSASTSSDPLAVTRVPAAIFRQAVIAKSTQEIDPEDGCSSMTLESQIETMVTAPMAAQSALVEFREQTLLPLQDMTSRLLIHLRGTFGDLEVSARPAATQGDDHGQQGMGGGAGSAVEREAERPARRRQRISSAWTEESMPEAEDVVNQMFDIMDVNSEDYQESTFTMQEMMELAVLHAKQIQLAQAQAREEVAAEIEAMRQERDEAQNTVSQLREEASQVSQRAAAASSDKDQRTNELTQQIESLRDKVDEQRREIEALKRQSKQQLLELEERLRRESANRGPHADFFVGEDFSQPGETSELQEASRRPRLNQPTRKLNRYGDAPDAFLKRLVYFMKRSKELREALIMQVRAMEQATIERQLASKFLLDELHGGRVLSPDPPLSATQFNQTQQRGWHPPGSSQNVQLKTTSKRRGMQSTTSLTGSSPLPDDVELVEISSPAPLLPRRSSSEPG
eukprot:m.56102 g.56102  ORF g.56102 m.56102 type:complete len:829 (+) comp6981_c0_seq1:23-2509(+)